MVIEFAKLNKDRQSISIGLKFYPKDLHKKPTEMVVLGQSVWEQYTIEVTIEYTYYDGQKGPRTWNHDVGDWTREAFVDQTTFEVF